VPKAYQIPPVPNRRPWSYEILWKRYQTCRIERLRLKTEVKDLRERVEDAQKALKCAMDRVMWFRKQFLSLLVPLNNAIYKDHKRHLPEIDDEIVEAQVRCEEDDG